MLSLRVPEPKAQLKASAPATLPLLSLDPAVLPFVKLPLLRVFTFSPSRLGPVAPLQFVPLSFCRRLITHRERTRSRAPLCPASCLAVAVPVFLPNWVKVRFALEITWPGADVSESRCDVYARGPRMRFIAS